MLLMILKMLLMILKMILMLLKMILLLLKMILLLLKMILMIPKMTMITISAVHEPWYLDPVQDPEWETNSAVQLHEPSSHRDLAVS